MVYFFEPERVVLILHTINLHSTTLNSIRFYTSNKLHIYNLEYNIVEYNMMIDCVLILTTEGRRSRQSRKSTEPFQILYSIQY